MHTCKLKYRTLPLPKSLFLRTDNFFVQHTSIWQNIQQKRMNLMIYLLVDLKIVLALHPKGGKIWSKSRLIWRGRLSEGGELTRTEALIKLWSLMGGAKPSRGTKPGKYGNYYLTKATCDPTWSALTSYVSELPSSLFGSSAMRVRFT